jgi:hypothetical protein
MSDYYKKSEIEAAMLNALSPLLVENGGYLLELDLYRGELSTTGVFKESVRTPSVFLAYSGSTYGAGTYLHADETITYNLIAFCRTGATPDACTLLEDVRGKLCGSRMGLDIKPLRLLREFSVGATKEFTTLSAVYSVTQKVYMPLQA